MMNETLLRFILLRFCLSQFTCNYERDEGPRRPPLGPLP